MSGHTPGPWVGHPETSNESAWVEAPYVGIVVADTRGRDDEASANARLIAELLEALKDVVAGLELFIHDPDTAPRVLAARIAIAKAEGGK